MLIYRKELDGLRALAVIAVIIYHANLKIAGGQIFKGGFFGVDVFFVLSGYLITGIIREKMKQGNFSFLDFYWRRAKRIVPALLGNENKLNKLEYKLTSQKLYSYQL